jgi:hypothetical protein
MTPAALDLLNFFAFPDRSEEMINRYTHLRPDFMWDELARVPDCSIQLGTENAKFDQIDPRVAAQV